eukprot:5278859-Karenia_brevis.AAC.1
MPLYLSPMVWIWCLRCHAKHYLEHLEVHSELHTKDSTVAASVRVSNGNSRCRGKYRAVFSDFVVYNRSVSPSIIPAPLTRGASPH